MIKNFIKIPNFWPKRKDLKNMIEQIRSQFNFDYYNYGAKYYPSPKFLVEKDQNEKSSIITTNSSCEQKEEELLNSSDSK